MNNLSIAYLTSFMLMSYIVSAQHAYFPNKGKIFFEREVYVKARMRDMQQNISRTNTEMSFRFGANIEQMPEKTSTYFIMEFDDDETLMRQDDSNTDLANTTRQSSTIRTNQGNRNNGRNSRSINRSAMRRNSSEKIYYQNFSTNETEIALELDDKYILKDSLQQVTWRFTDEYREIAGYTCRRVNGATADSLYLVAFYTEQIPLSGGPALAGGLPGMILGLAIPEMHINYWATEVSFTVDNVTKQWREKKSKQMSIQDFFKSLENNRIYGGGRSSNPSQIRRNLLESLIY